MIIATRALLATCALAAVACGARTSIERAHGAAGGGEAPTTIAAGAGGGAPPAAVTGSGVGGGGGGGGGCVPETFGGPDSAGAQRIAIDDEHAVWTTVDGRLVRARLGGGPPEVLLDDLVDPGAVTLDGDRVLLATDGDIVAVPVVGGPPAVVVPEAGSVVMLAADATGIYWMAGGNGVLAYALERLAPGGTRSALVAPIDFGVGVALTAEHVVFTAQALAGVDELDLVARVPKEGGPVEVLAAGRADPTNVFVRGEDLFWTEQLDATGGATGVVRLSPGDVAPSHVLVAPSGALPLLASATTTTIVLTAFDPEDGALLLAAPLAGGETTILARDAGFFLEPATAGARVAVTVQPPVDDPEATTDAEVRVFCP